MKEGKITRRKMMETVLTVEKFQPYFENIKDLIRSTEAALRKELKATETRLRKEINEVRDGLHATNSEIRSMQAAILENGRAIRETKKELRAEMHAMEDRLTKKIDSNTSRLDDLTKRDELH